MYGRPSGSSIYGTPSANQRNTAQGNSTFTEGFSFGSASTGPRSNGLEKGFGSSGDYATMSSSHGGNETPQQKYLPTFLAPSPTTLETSSSNLRTSQNYRTPKRESDAYGFDSSFYGDEAPPYYNNPNTSLSTTSTPVQQRRAAFHEAPSTSSRFNEYSPNENLPLRSSSSGLRLHPSKEQIPGASLYDLEDFEPRNPSPTNKSIGGSTIPSMISSPSDMPTLDYPLRKGNRSSASLRDERWVTVFGFPSANTSMVLRKFQTYGDIIHHLTSPGNWVHIQYQTVQQARNALKKNGTLIGNLMIGVCECQDNVAYENPIQAGSLSEVKKKNQINAEYSVEPSDIIKKTPQLRNTLWSLFLEYVFGL